MNDLAKVIGYQDGYMHKQAGPIGTGISGGAAAGSFVAEGAANILPYVLLIPALMGAGAGSLHSKMTSPSNVDQETVQKSLEAAELEEFQAELQRRRDDAARKSGDPGNSGARTLHI